MRLIHIERLLRPQDLIILSNCIKIQLKLTKLKQRWCHSSYTPQAHPSTSSSGAQTERDPVSTQSINFNLLTNSDLIPSIKIGSTVKEAKTLKSTEILEPMWLQSMEYQLVSQLNSCLSSETGPYSTLIQDKMDLTLLLWTLPILI